MTENEVSVDRQALELLIDESENLIEAMDEPGWMEGYGSELQDAVVEGQRAIQESR